MNLYQIETQITIGGHWWPLQWWQMQPGHLSAFLTYFPKMTQLGSFRVRRVEDKPGYADFEFDGKAHKALA